jgi:hypothetical protein
MVTKWKMFSMKLMSIGWFDEMSNKRIVVVVTHVCCCRGGTSERWRLSACGGVCRGAGFRCWADILRAVGRVSLTLQLRRRLDAVQLPFSAGLASRWECWVRIELQSLAAEAVVDSCRRIEERCPFTPWQSNSLDCPFHLQVWVGGAYEDRGRSAGERGR